MALAPCLEKKKTNQTNKKQKTKQNKQKNPQNKQAKQNKNKKNPASDPLKKYFILTNSVLLQHQKSYGSKPGFHTCQI